jgi:hypothetical protein
MGGCKKAFPREGLLLYPFTTIPSLRNLTQHDNVFLDNTTSIGNGR